MCFLSWPSIRRKAPSRKDWLSRGHVDSILPLMGVSVGYLPDRERAHMRKMTLLASTAALLMATLQIVHAQSIRIGPGGVSLDFGAPPPPQAPPPAVVVEEPAPVQLIDRREAREIATSQGMLEIFSVDRDNTQYVIRGLDEVGGRMRVILDAVDGRVLDIVRRQAVALPAPPPAPEPEVFVEEEGEARSTSRARAVPAPSAQKPDPQRLNVRRDSESFGRR